MLDFLNELALRNAVLFWFSALLFFLAMLFYLLTIVSPLQVRGVNAWYKPFKFALSISIYCGTMGWFCYYLPGFNIPLFSWSNILLFSFEMAYISIQAGRKQESHFNQSTPVYSALFAGMAIAAICISLYAGYVTILFFRNSFPELPYYYVWSVRFGLIIFVVSSFEGLLMGARQSHTVGKREQDTFLPLFKWNMKEGDLRVAHFAGMHALQVIPLLSYYVLKNTSLVFLLSIVYAFFVYYVFIQAIRSRPFIQSKKIYGVISKGEVQAEK